ncbi:FHA domain-containing protein [Nocardia sp. CA-128927]|uniref:FHA domain-containing protein n=1 Tax=Nocardia sp. CA-128927 TaxID=3239975 RepID=UPI003D9814E3
MRSKPSTVGIAQGAGLVARFGGVVVYLAGETASTDRILGTIETVAEAEHPGAALAQRLAAVVFGNASELSPFGVVAPTDDGTLILLRGPVFAEINGAEGTRRLDGARAFTWVDEIVREPLRRITVGTDTGSTLKALPRTDLRAGVVPGGGFVLQVAVRRAGKAAKSSTASRTSASAPSSTTPRPSAATSSSATPRPSAATSSSVSPRLSATSASEPAPTVAAGFAATPEPTGADEAVEAPAAPGSDTRDSAASATSGTRNSAASATSNTRNSGASATSGTRNSPASATSDTPNPATAATSDSPTPATTASTDAPTSAASATSSTALGSSAARSSSSPSAPSATRSAAAASSTTIKPSESARPRARPRPPIGNRPAADRQLAWSQTHQPEPIALHKTSATRTVRPAAEHDQAAGTLVLENGTAYPLDRPYVIGRGPQTDDAVRTATAAPIVIQRDRHVSRVHAYVSVNRGKVFVRDATATSGTFIAPPGTDQWTRIGTSPTELRPGWSVRISERVLTYRCQPDPDHREA